MVLGCCGGGKVCPLRRTERGTDVHIHGVTDTGIAWSEFELPTFLSVAQQGTQPTTDRRWNISKDTPSLHGAGEEI